MVIPYIPPKISWELAVFEEYCVRDVVLKEIENTFIDIGSRRVVEANLSWEPLGTTAPKSYVSSTPGDTDRNNWEKVFMTLGDNNSKKGECTAK